MLEASDRRSTVPSVRNHFLGAIVTQRLDVFGVQIDAAEIINRTLVFELATARFVAQREDALLLGPPGTGKSHISQAIGRPG